MTIAPVKYAIKPRYQMKDDLSPVEKVRQSLNCNDLILTKQPLPDFHQERHMALAPIFWSFTDVVTINVLLIPFVNGPLGLMS